MIAKAANPLIALRRPLWPAAEVTLLLAAAAGTAVLVHKFLVAVDFNPLGRVSTGFGPIWAGLMIALAAAGYLVRRRGGVAVLAGVAAGLVTAPITAGLSGTDQPLNSILRGDMAFRTEYVTRFASTWHLSDYTFKGLDAFYPPAWFWLAGRTAHVLGLEQPWHIMKPFTIVTIGAALAIAFLLWRTVLTPAGALAAAVGSSLVLNSQVGPLRFATTAWYSPYSCFVAVVGAAWLAATLHALRMPRARARLVLLALVGAVLALCYYLLFVILAVVLFVLAAVSPAPRRWVLARLAALGAGVVALTAVFWVPLLAALVHGAASQGQFVRPDFFRVATGITGGPVALTVLSIVAVAALALTLAWPGSQAVAGLIGGAIVYQFISVMTLVFAHNQLQPHRAVTMMWATLGAAVPVALDGSRGIGGKLQPALRRSLVAVPAAVAIGATFALGSAQGTDLSSGPFVRAAHAPPAALAPTNAMSSFITRTTGKPPQRLTIVAGDPALLVTQPYYGFLPLRARYAHPEAHLEQRISLLRRAARCPGPACLTSVIDHSRFGRIDALVLDKSFGKLRIQTQEDRFPVPRDIAIDFRPRLFRSPAWVKRDFGRYVVLVRRGLAAVAGHRARTDDPVMPRRRHAGAAALHRLPHRLVQADVRRGVRVRQVPARRGRGHRRLGRVDRRPG